MDNKKEPMITIPLEEYRFLVNNLIQLMGGRLAEQEQFIKAVQNNVSSQKKN